MIDKIRLKTTRLALAGAALLCGGVVFASGALDAAPKPATPALDKAAIEQIVHDYLLSHPELIAEMSNKLDALQDAADTKARNDALAKLGLKALFDPKIAYVSGPADAKVTLAEFFDYRCVHCKASLPAIQHLVNSGQKVRIAFIEHPILTQDSIVAAVAAVAARRQGSKYLPFHFALMATTGDLPKDRILSIAKSSGLDVAKLEKDMTDPAIVETVKQSNALADRLHFNGTPTFVINGKIVVGEITDAELQDLTRQPKG